MVKKTAWNILTKKVFDEKPGSSPEKQPNSVILRSPVLYELTTDQPLYERASDVMKSE